MEKSEFILWFSKNWIYSIPKKWTYGIPYSIIKNSITHIEYLCSTCYDTQNFILIEFFSLLLYYISPPILLIYKRFIYFTM